MDISEFTGSSRLAAPSRPVDLVRLGLVSGAVLAAGFAVGALAYLTESGSPARTEAKQVTSRIPRPRPSEPVATGSIRPATPKPGDVKLIPLDLESALASAASDPAHARAREQLRSKAILTASASAECDEVAGSEVLEIRSNPERSAVVWVQCRNGARFYLDRDRLETSPLPQTATAGPLALSDTDAVRACEDKVRLGLPMPASLARRAQSTDIDRAPGYDPVVTFEADALNGLGFPLAFHVQCMFADRRIARLQIDPR